MKTIRYTNESGDLAVDILVDLIGGNDMLTIYESKGLEDADKSFGFNFKVPGEYTLAEMKAFAEDNNLTMKIIEEGESTVTSNEYTALGITTTSLPGGTASGAIQVETITIPATASATQGDYIVISNYNGETLAAWLDIDEDGTPPTGVKYTGADYQVKIPIETGGLTAANGTLFANAISSVPDWSRFVAVVDNGDGSVEVTQKSAGDVANADPENTDSSGAGSITVLVDTDGVGGVINVETVTVPATASATQGDFIILTNYLQETVAVWLDIDDDGTEPSGTKYTATDYQVEVDIAGGANTATNGTAFYDALLASDWADQVTLVDNEDGSVEITQNVARAITAADPENAAEDGVGSITAITDTTGKDAEYLNDDLSAVQLAYEGGNAPVTWTAESLPAGLTLSSDGTISGVPTASADTYTVTFTVTDFYDVTDSSDIDIVLA